MLISYSNSNLAPFLQAGGCGIVASMDFLSYCNITHILWVAFTNTSMGNK